MKSSPFPLPTLAVLCCLLANRAHAEDFVRARGLELVVGEQPLHFVGANVSVTHGPRERAHAEQTLDAVAHDGLKVIRVWALGEAPDNAPAWWSDFAFRSSQQTWYDSSFVHLDRVLAGARERGLKVILVFANRWKDYGGVPQYLSWASRNDVPRDKRGDVSPAGLREFFRSEVAREIYKAHAKRLIERVNSVTGIAYRDDPTIFAWELMNELSSETALDQRALVDWVQTMAQFVRSLDGNHLISAGHIGYDTLRERSAWRAIQALPEIDYCDVHAYPTFERPAQLLRWTDDRIQLCHGAIQKPLIFGEFGFEGEPLERARSVRTWLARVRQRGVAGALIWLYEPGDGSRRHSVSTLAAAAPATLPIREALAAEAHMVGRAAKKPTLPRPSAGDPSAPLFQLEQRITGPSTIASALAPKSGPIRTLLIDPFAFTRAEFERAGTYGGPPVMHMYGAGVGFVEYRFRTPALALRSLTLRARASSELHGDGWGADESETSRVHVEIDGMRAATLELPPDNGRGHAVEVELTYKALLARVGQPGTHTLRFVVDGSGFGNGLCLYSQAVDKSSDQPEPHSFIALDFALRDAR